MTLELRKLLVLTGACLGAIVAALVGLAIAVGLTAPGRAAPKEILQLALEEHERHAFRPFDESRSPMRSDRLRGLTETEAEAILASCSTASEWAYLGEEESHFLDCAPFVLFACERETGSLVARIWMDQAAVDHRADLVYGSDFFACRTGQCPDFAVGEPRNDGVLTCETLFKVKNPVTRQ